MRECSCCTPLRTLTFRLVVTTPRRPTDAREKYGDTDPKTLLKMDTLATALSELPGRLGEAEALYREVLAKARETKGDKHEDTLNNMYNLAGALSNCAARVRTLDRTKESATFTRCVLV